MVSLPFFHSLFACPRAERGGKGICEPSISLPRVYLAGGDLERDDVAL